MAMSVDAAGRDPATGSVNLGRGAGQTGGERGYLAILDANVGVKGIAGGRDMGVFYN